MSVTTTEPAQRRRVSKATKTSTKTVNVAQRRRDAIELRKANATWDRIAAALGYTNAKAAARDVRTHVEAIQQETRDDMTRMLYEEYCHQCMLLWKRMQGGDLPALDRWIKIKQEITKLLGLGAPERMDLNLEHSGAIDHDSVLVIEGNEAEYIAALKRGLGFSEEDIAALSHAADDHD